MKKINLILFEKKKRLFDDVDLDKKGYITYWGLYRS